MSYTHSWGLPCHAFARRWRVWHALIACFAVGAPTIASAAEVIIGREVDGRKSPTHWTGHVDLFYGDRQIRLNGISGESYCSAVAVAETLSGSERRKTVVCGIGVAHLHGKDGEEPFAGDDPGESIVFVDPGTGEYSRSSFHAPHPEQIVVSPDGKYVGCATRFGWSVDPVVNGGRPQFEVKAIREGVGLDASQASEKLRELLVGTVQCAVWDVAERRPIWEMRFHPRTLQGWENAKFGRPWDQYARIALPWWAMNADAEYMEWLQIGFTPRSEHFIRLDGRYGITILRMRDGKQTHWKADAGQLAPRAFFCADETVVRVVMSDGSMRIIDVDSGAERADLRQEAAVKGNAAAPRFLGWAMCPTANVFGRANKGLLTFRSASQSEPATGFPESIPGVGSDQVYRLDLSRNRRWLGVRYQRHIDQYEVVTDSGLLGRYELIDLERRRVVKRVFSDYDQGPVRATEVGVATVDIGAHILTACLTPEGDDIVYVASGRSR